MYVVSSFGAQTQESSALNLGCIYDVWGGGFASEVRLVGFRMMTPLHQQSLKLREFSTESIFLPSPNTSTPGVQFGGLNSMFAT